MIAFFKGVLTLSLSCVADTADFKHSLQVFLSVFHSSEWERNDPFQIKFFWIWFYWLFLGLMFCCSFLKFKDKLVAVTENVYVLFKMIFQALFPLLQFLYRCGTFIQNIICCTGKLRYKSDSVKLTLPLEGEFNLLP